MTKRGYTLLEMVIVLGLLPLVLGVAYAYLIPTLRMFHSGSYSASSYASATVVATRMQADVSMTTPPAVTLAVATSGTTALVLRRLSGLTNVGELRWEPALVLFVWIPSTGEIVREVWQPPQPPASLTDLASQVSDPTRIARPPTAAEIQTLLQAGLSRELLARSVSSFDVAVGMPPHPLNGTVLEQPLQVHLRIAGAERAPDFDLTRALPFHNGLP